MTTTKTESSKSASIDGVSDRHQPDQEAIDRLAGLLPREELEDALKGLDPDQITGPGGLLTQLAGRVIETALGAELTDHLGYPPGGACPVGYAWSGTFCLSLDGKRPPAMPKPTGSACPSGWRGSAEGSYCITR